MFSTLVGINQLTVRVVLAADCLCVAKMISQPQTINTGLSSLYSPATAAAYTDDGHRGAGQPDEGVDVLDNDADRREDGGGGGVGRLLDGLAALNRTRAARLSRRVGGNGKDGGGGEELEHLESSWSSERLVSVL